MCRCRGFLIGGAKKGHGKISWPNPIGKHIQVLQQNRGKTGHRPGVPKTSFLTLNGHGANKVFALHNAGDRIENAPISG
jgi:hypothetical protein